MIAQVLMESYNDLLKHVARRLGGAADAADIMQDTFLRIERIPPETVIANPRSYLFRMADNVATDHLRSRAARARHFTDQDITQVKADQADAEQTVDYRQRLVLLERVIADLPPRQRQVFLLHKFDGYSHSQIATQLGISRSAVEKLIMKALATCRERLGDLLSET